MANCIATFVIGLFAGICAVFVPRLGGLLTVDDPTNIAVFPMVFVMLGVAYAAIVGVVVAIIYYGKAVTPGERFMTALGVPALLAGALATSAHTGSVQQLRATNASLATAAVKAEKIEKIDSPTLITPLKEGPPVGSTSGLERMLGISVAVAQQPGTPSSGGNIAAKGLKWNDWAKIQSPEPDYAIFLEKTTSAATAESAANGLRSKFPNAQAVKTEKGYGVISGVKPESAAVLEAVRIKQEFGLQTELVRMK